MFFTDFAVAGCEDVLAQPTPSESARAAAAVVRSSLPPASRRARAPGPRVAREGSPTGPGFDAMKMCIGLLLPVSRGTDRSWREHPGRAQARPPRRTRDPGRA